MIDDVVDVRNPREGLWNNRHLIWNFARRDLKGRFKGTLVGWLWSLLLPLGTVQADLDAAIHSLHPDSAPASLDGGTNADPAALAQ